MYARKSTLPASPLSRLRVGDRGRIAHLKSTGEVSAHELRTLGLDKGLPITLEARSPAFIVRFGNHRLKLKPNAVRSIYVCLSF